MFTTCNFSCVTCPLTPVTCHNSCVIFFIFIFFLNQLSQLVEGLFSAGPTPSSLNQKYKKLQQNLRRPNVRKCHNSKEWSIFLHSRLLSRELNFGENFYLPRCVTCHVSHVMCHVSCVMWHASHVTCNIFWVFLDKRVELVSGGSVINRACPVQFQ